MILAEAVTNEDKEVEEITQNLNQDQEVYHHEIESLNQKEELMKNLKVKNKVKDKDQYHDQ